MWGESSPRLGEEQGEATTSREGREKRAPIEECGQGVGDLVVGLVERRREAHLEVEREVLLPPKEDQFTSAITIFMRVCSAHLVY